MPHKSAPADLVEPKQEYRDPAHHQDASDHIKEEPREYPSIPPGFPPYYLHPGITPHHVYGGGRQEPSPPASPPRGSHLPPNLYQQYHQRQLYTDSSGARHPGLSAVLEMAYDVHNHNSSYNVWQSHNQDNPHPPPVLPQTTTTHMPSPAHNTWTIPLPSHDPGQVAPNSYNLKPNLPIALTVEKDSSILKKKGRKSKQTEDDSSIHPSQQPPKKRGMGKGKTTKDSSGPKRVFTCPHCQRSYDWNYNLNRHLKYECGKENAFMCSKCGRRFPHKQNCVYHLKRKHKIVCETIDQYVSNGLVLFKGSGSVPPHQGESAMSPRGRGSPPLPLEHGSPPLLGSPSGLGHLQ